MRIDRGKLIVRVVLFLILTIPCLGHTWANNRALLPIVNRSNTSGVYIFSAKRNKLTVAEILSKPYIQMPSSFKELSNYNIVSFTLVIVNIDNAIPVSIELSFDKNISASSQKIIKELKTGSQIFIEDVKAVGPDKIIRRLSGRAIKII